MILKFNQYEVFFNPGKFDQFKKVLKVTNPIQIKKVKYGK